MNPVTRQLLARITDRRLIRFVEAWDALEALVIRIYKTGQVAPGDEQTYRRIHRRLCRLLPRYAAALESHWRQTTINGQPVTDDPFAALFAPDDISAFVGDWDMMQRLPAAREALNGWLLDRVNEQ
jgi:hypothetical protein